MNKNKTKIFQYLNDNLPIIGIHGFTIDNMSKEIKMSKRTIYKTFPNKKILLKTYLFEYIEKFTIPVNKISISDIPPLEKFTKIIFTFAQSLLPFIEQYSKDIKMLYPDIWQDVEKIRQGKLVYFEQMYKDLWKAGLTNKNISPEHFAFIFKQFISAIIQPEVLFNNKISFREIILTFSRVVFQGALNNKSQKEFEQILKNLEKLEGF